jgi:hypothetical protein
VYSFNNQIIAPHIALRSNKELFFENNKKLPTLKKFVLLIPTKSQFINRQKAQ